MGQYRVIDYHEDRHKPMEHYVSVCESKGYKYAVDFWPWDAGSDLLITSLQAAMRQRGRNVRVLPRSPREAGIDRVREILGTCWFDVEKCELGLQRLRYYRYGNTAKVDPVTGNSVITLEPIHDDNSHGADALRSFAMGIRMPVGEPPVDRQRRTPLPRFNGSYTPFA